MTGSTVRSVILDRVHVTRLFNDVDSHVHVLPGRSGYAVSTSCIAGGTLAASTVGPIGVGIVVALGIGIDVARSAVAVA